MPRRKTAGRNASYQRQSDPDVSDLYRLVSSTKVLDRDKEHDLAVAMRQGSKRARDELITANLRFVLQIALKFHKNGLPVADLFQTGSIGLMKACRKFDPARRTKFLTYAAWWIRAEMRLAIFDKLRIEGTPRRSVEDKRKIMRAEARDRSRDGRAPPIGKIAKKTGLRPERIRQLREELPVSHISLDAPCGEDIDGNPMHNAIPNHQPAPDDLCIRACENEMLKRTIERIMPQLDARERYILKHRLRCETAKGLAAIGRRFDISRERARQIEKRLKCKLRDALVT